MKYKYANSILWGPTYNKETGMHEIEAATDEAAFALVNRSDKEKIGLRCLYRLDEITGQWVNVGDEQDRKVKRVGGAVVRLEAELIAEGKQAQASQLVAAFATLPPASMARLHDILTA